MSDWKKYVREHMPPLGLSGPREAEIMEELAQQLEGAYTEALARGSTEAEAETRAAAVIPDWLALAEDIRRAERSLLGGLPEPVPETGMRRFAADFWQDVLYGARLLARTPGFAAVLILTLALGIGANSMMFTVVNAVLLRPLPYPDSQQLVLVRDFNHEAGFDSFSVAPGNFLDWRAQSHSFSGMAAFGNANFNYTGGTYPERLSGRLVTEGFLDVLGVQPVVGRNFQASDFQPGQDHVVLLSYGLWQKILEGDAQALGRSIKLNDEVYTVIGVLPPGLRFVSQENDIWAPWAFPPQWKDVRGAHFLSVLARRKPEVSLEAARAEMTTIGQRLAAQYPDANRGWGVRTDLLYEYVVGDVRPALLLLLAAVGVLLLIACGNVANMLLARTVERRREMAVRASLGAGRWRLIRQMLAEGLLLSLTGGALGLLLAAAGTHALVAYAPRDLPRAYAIQLDPRVFGFTLAVAVLTGIAFGLAPVFTVARHDLQETLKESGRGSAGRQGLRGALVSAEVALALVLLVGAGLLLTSFARLETVAPGFRTERAQAFDVRLPRVRYPDAAHQTAFYQSLLERLRELPGVESAAAVTTLPLSGLDESYTFEVEGKPNQPGKEPSAMYYNVTPGYFQAMGIPVLSGRDFSASDAPGAPRVCIINDVLAREYYPDENPVGRRLFLGAGPGHEYREIVGVVGSVKHYWLGEKPSPQAYEPLAQMPNSGVTIVVRASLEPASLAAGVRGAVQAADAQLPISRVTTFEQLVTGSVSLPRFRTLLLGLFAAFAVALAVVGLYGVMSYTVTQRTREIGIRMMLGAQRGGVYRLVVGQGMFLVGVGVVVGLGSAFGLTHFMKRFLFGIEATDPATFVGVSMLLIAVAGLACFLPARRASRVDPLESLRYE